jgi:hypothetical protein
VPHRPTELGTHPVMAKAPPGLLLTAETERRTPDHEACDGGSTEDSAWKGRAGKPGQHRRCRVPGRDHGAPRHRGHSRRGQRRGRPGPGCRGPDGSGGRCGHGRHRPARRDAAGSARSGGYAGQGCRSWKRRAGRIPRLDSTDPTRPGCRSAHSPPGPCAGCEGLGEPLTLIQS